MVCTIPAVVPRAIDLNLRLPIDPEVSNLLIWVVPISLRDLGFDHHHDIPLVDIMSPQSRRTVHVVRLKLGKKRWVAIRGVVVGKLFPGLLEIVHLS